MKILIAGGGGFLGAELVKYAVSLGWDVTSISLHKNPYSRAAHNIIANIAKKQDLEDIKGDEYDYVINAAGYVDHSNYINGGRELIEEHLSGVMNLVDLSRSKRLKCFLQLSTGDEYGESTSPQNENMRESPMTPYALSRVCSTHFLQMMNKSIMFPAVVARIFLVYGEDQKNNRLIPFVISNCLDGNSFAVGEGEAYRDFCHIDDVVDALFRCLQSEQAVGQVLNIGSGVPIKVRDLINKIIELSDGGVAKFGQRREQRREPSSLVSDSSKAKKTIGWKQQITLKNGLNRVIQEYTKKNAAG